ncbi:unnamed protein product [Moneuplotes crassus]|uniref:BACK domain-containing protein n=1 Tax=Euplotes crassus TaxID=5936 RepID=A0AAD1XLL3_EUPCR|nr:unnamed protein product [Moneuplotes crassus]
MLSNRRSQKVNCLYALNETYLKLQESDLQDESQYWTLLTSMMMDFCVFHLRYFLKWQRSQLLELANISLKIFEMMISKSIVYFFPDPYHDHTDVIEFLMEVKDFDNIFELFDHEKQLASNDENSRIEGEVVQDCFSWKIGAFKGNYFKETPPFAAEECYWSILLSYIKEEDDFLNVSLRMVNNPYEKRNEAYYKKEEYYYQLPDDFGIGYTGRSSQEVSSIGLAQHSLVYISAGVKLDERDDFDNIQLFPLICASKIPTLLAKIPKNVFLQEQESIQIFFYTKIKPTLSALLSYISKNFDLLHDDQKIALLSEDDLCILLRHKDISVGHEDQVLKAVCLWRIKRPIENDYSKVYSCINWNYCSLPCILKVLYKYKSVREDKYLKSFIEQEFLRRCKKSQDNSKVSMDPPRLRYKYIGGIKSLIPDEQKQFTPVLPFLVENHSKLFIERMFETIIDIMKTAKITKQNDEIITKAEPKRNLLGENEEEKRLSLKGSHFHESLSMSDESLESESDESAGNDHPDNLLANQEIFKQLQNPAVDIQELLQSYKLKKEICLKEKENLVNQLKNVERNHIHEIEPCRRLSNCENQNQEVISEVIANPFIHNNGCHPSGRKFQNNSPSEDQDQLEEPEPESLMITPQALKKNSPKGSEKEVFEVHHIKSSARHSEESKHLYNEEDKDSEKDNYIVSNSSIKERFSINGMGKANCSTSRNPKNNDAMNKILRDSIKVNSCADFEQNNEVAYNAAPVVLQTANFDENNNQTPDVSEIKKQSLKNNNFVEDNNLRAILNSKYSVPNRSPDGSLKNEMINGVGVKKSYQSFSRPEKLLCTPEALKDVFDNEFISKLRKEVEEIKNPKAQDNSRTPPYHKKPFQNHYSNIKTTNTTPNIQTPIASPKPSPTDLKIPKPPLNLHSPEAFNDITTSLFPNKIFQDPSSSQPLFKDLN